MSEYSDDASEQNEVKELADEISDVGVNDGYDEVLEWIELWTHDRDLAMALADTTSHPDEDIKFFEEYLNATRAPGSYKIKVTRTFRIQHQGSSSFHKLDNHQVLMHGVDGKNFFEFFVHGFGNQPEKGGPKALFGPGFYFTNCSTKALNWAADEEGYCYERKADKGEITPDVAHPTIIMVCDVACGRPYITLDPRKKIAGLELDYDSVSSDSFYKAQKSVVVPIPAEKDEEVFHASRVTSLPYELKDDPNVVDGGTNFSEVCVYEPEQIQMLWMLEVERIE